MVTSGELYVVTVAVPKASVVNLLPEGMPTLEAKDLGLSSDTPCGNNRLMNRVSSSRYTFRPLSSPLA